MLEADTPRGELRLRVTLPADGMLVLAEPYYVERRARVDGMPAAVEKANMALSAVPVKAGAHLVELLYVPTGLRWGAGISLATLLIGVIISRTPPSVSR